MSDLVAFLNARYDEDATYLAEAEDSPCDCWAGAWTGTCQMLPDCGRRLLREVEAKRKILADLPAYSKQRREMRDHMYLPENADYHTGHADGTDDAFRFVLRQLAVGYSDHDDYRQEWA